MSSSAKQQKREFIAYCDKLAAEQKAAENGEDEDDGDEDDTDVGIGSIKGDDEATAVKEKRKRKNKPRNKQNKCWIYITGLPIDVTTEELKSHFSKVIV